MIDQPLISIITSSLNQGKFIEKTIKSVLNQDYPSFEHIIVDGMSTDETSDILARYPHLKVIREPDHGQADAINKGFAIAKGDILGFLNSDDTLEPGTFKKVANSIDPSTNRHIVMGRCQFIDEHDQLTGIEHPSFYINHRRLLAFWKSHGIPQPAVFWSKTVLSECGPLNANEQLVLDYDIFCRFSKHYSFHFINEIFANYRLHDHSKTCLNDDNKRFKETLRVSMQYWGPFLSKQQLWLRWSLLSFLRDQYSRKLLRKGKCSLDYRHFFKSFLYLITGAVLGLDVLYYNLKNRFINKFKIKIKNFSIYIEKMHKYYPQIMAYLNYKKIWPDQWMGPEVIFPTQIPINCRYLHIIGETILATQIFDVTIYKDQNIMTTFSLQNSKSSFVLKIPLPNRTEVGNYSVKIVSKRWAIMHHHIRNQDFRPLSWKLLSVDFSN